MMIEAVSNLKKNNGLVNQQNEILNNCINIHKFEQKDIELLDSQIKIGDDSNVKQIETNLK